MTDVLGNYRLVTGRIAEAAERAGRDPREVRLLAAAKSQSVDLIRAAIAAGVSLIGENYVQEAQAKKSQIEDSVEWHMIGHLQRNKVKAAVLLFDVIESLDSVTLARELDREGRRTGKKIRAFIEVNLAGEESKSGMPSNGVRQLAEAAADLPNLDITGLMVVPPLAQDPEAARPYFRELRALGERLNAQQIANVKIGELSMGMTNDYAVAVEEGATIVRIGTALFGARKQ
jgi:pyridoxal phosphate enzyme (YggS family)